MRWRIDLRFVGVCPGFTFSVTRLLTHRQKLKMRTTNGISHHDVEWQRAFGDTAGKLRGLNDGTEGHSRLISMGTAQANILALICLGQSPE